MARLYRRSRQKTEQQPSGKLSFLLNGELVELDPVSPTLTILDFLRKDRGLCGTKEGCAEGDCGACTVTIGELQGSKMSYQAVNSCISFVCSLHGKHLITVEGIKQGDKLHPLQQCMVSAHGSQCGFCTPGFVMSLYTLCYQEEPKFNRQQMNDLLAGNLCRCTGYRPIVSAAKKFLKRKNLSRYAYSDQSVAAQLKKQHFKKSHSFILDDATYHSPTTTDELANLLRDYPDATLVAGGTDVGLWVTKQHQKLDQIISLERIDALKIVRIGKDMISFGAGVNLNSAQHALAPDYPDLGELIRRFGSEQIRNRATVAGNIANGSPIGDLAPALMVLDAKLTLRVGTYRRYLKLEEFFIDYGKQDLKTSEFIESIQIPRVFKDSRFSVYKISKRFDQDISAVCGAFNLQVDYDGIVRDIRIAFGGMAGIPKRASKLERALMDEPWNLQTINKVLPLMEKDFQPITDCRGSSEYRLLAAKNLLKRFFLETQSEVIETRLIGAANG